MHAGTTSRAAGQRDAVRVAAEHDDVIAYPPQREGLVLHTSVAGYLVVAGAEETWRRISVSEFVWFKPH